MSHKLLETAFGVKRRGIPRVSIEVPKGSGVSAVSCRFVYVYLAWKADQHTLEANPSVASIAAATGVEPRSVRRALAVLVDQGLIEPKNGKRTGGRYGKEGQGISTRYVVPYPDAHDQVNPDAHDRVEDGLPGRPGSSTWTPTTSTRTPTSANPPDPPERREGGGGGASPSADAGAAASEMLAQINAAKGTDLVVVTAKMLKRIEPVLAAGWTVRQIVRAITADWTVIRSSAQSVVEYRLAANCVGPPPAPTRRERLEADASPIIVELDECFHQNTWGKTCFHLTCCEQDLIEMHADAGFEVDEDDQGERFGRLLIPASFTDDQVDEMVMRIEESVHQCRKWEAEKQAERAATAAQRARESAEFLDFQPAPVAAVGDLF